MLDLVATTLLAPVLVGASTVVARRAGPRAGGIVSAFPAIVGPVLVIDLLEHGAAFAARAATGTLLGLAALAGFALTYGRVARRSGWPAALVAAWALAIVVGAAVSGLGTGPLAAALLAGAALVVAARGLPPAAALGARVRGTGTAGLPARMAASAALVVALAVAAGALGPTAGGVLAALPVLASVLAVFTHRDEGAEAAIALLRGMLAGMAGFLAFCLVVALLVEPAGAAAAFAAATGCAIAAQAGAAVHGEPGWRSAAELRAAPPAL